MNKRKAYKLAITALKKQAQILAPEANIAKRMPNSASNAMKKRLAQYQEIYETVKFFEYELLEMTGK